MPVYFRQKQVHLFIYFFLLSQSHLWPVLAGTHCAAEAAIKLIPVPAPPMCRGYRYVPHLAWFITELFQLMGPTHAGPSSGSCTMTVDVAENQFKHELCCWQAIPRVKLNTEELPGHEPPVRGTSSLCCLFVCLFCPFILELSLSFLDVHSYFSLFENHKVFYKMSFSLSLSGVSSWLNSATQSWVGF